MTGYAALRNGGLQLRGSSSGAAWGTIRNAAIPSIAVFPLLQHTGTPAEPAVAPGDRVREGTTIARASGPISASIHSSIPGVVVGLRRVRLPNGESSEAVVVKLEGEFDRLGKSQKSREDDATAGTEKLLEHLVDNGLVTLDSHAVPLQAIWKLPRGMKVDRLVVSAVNDEPLLSVEHRLSTDRSDALADGLALAARVLGPRSITYVAESVEPNAEVNTELIGTLKSSAANVGADLSWVEISNRYPRGEPRELVRAATGQTVVPGSSLLELGIVVTNVSTLVAVRDAIMGGKPLIERYVTVAGGAISRPANLRVRIGTPVRDLIEECGGFSVVPERIVMGGPLTGTAVYDLDTPIMKNTTAVLALSRRESRSGERAPCINCGRCLTACPEGLNPTRLFKEVERGRHDNAVAAGLLNCSECGSCSFVCPSRIPLLYGMRLGKRLAQGAEWAQ